MTRSDSNILMALFAVAASAIVSFASAPSAYASGGPSPPLRLHRTQVVVIDWSQLGSSGTPVSLPTWSFWPPPATVSSSGNSAEVTDSSSYPSYPPGQALLFVPGSDIKLTFAEPLWGGVFAYIQAGNQQPFTAQVTIDFGPGIFNGMSSSFSWPFYGDGYGYPANGPVPFGYLPSGDPLSAYSIVSMEVDITSPNPGGLVIGTVYTAVPEMATWVAMLVGFAGLGSFSMLRARGRWLQSGCFQRVFATAWKKAVSADVSIEHQSVSSK